MGRNPHLPTFRSIAVLTALLALPSSLAVAQDAPSSAPVSSANESADPGKLGEMSLEELMNIPVVAAGRREQMQRQVAAAVSTVTAEEIKLFGYRNITDILRGQRGFYIFDDGLNSFAGVRGFLRPGEWNARTLLLVDGRPTREIIYGMTSLEQEFVVPVEAIKRVEIVRGPGSALYGGNAVFGVVNVVTKDGAEINGTELHIQGGTRGMGRISALYGTKTKDDWDIMGNIAGYTSRGDDDIKYDGVNDPALNFGHIVDSDYEGAYAMFLKVRKGDFTATFDLENRQRDNRSAKYLASFFDTGIEYEKRANVTFRFDHEIRPGQSIHAMAYYGYYDYEEKEHYDADPPNSVPASLYLSEANASWIGEEIHYDWQVNPKLHLLAGADATQSLHARQRSDDGLGSPVMVQENSYNSWAVFAEAEYKATDWLTLVGGARVDHVQRIGFQFSPRAAALVMPTKVDTIKLLYGRAFRAPNLYEQFYETAGYVPNPDLDPEVVDTYEIAWERQFRSGWQTSLGAFFWKMTDSLQDVIVDVDGSQQTQNGGDMRAHGIEAELQRRWENGARLRVHGSLTRVEDDDGDRPTHSPEWIVGTSIAVPVLNRKTFISIDSQFVGPQLSDVGIETDASYLTNIVFTAREVGKIEGLEFQLGVYNLFADDSRQPSSGEGVFYQPTLNNAPTQFVVGLTYRF